MASGCKELATPVKRSRREVPVSPSPTNSQPGRFLLYPPLIIWKQISGIIAFRCARRAFLSPRVTVSQPAKHLRGQERVQTSWGWGGQGPPPSSTTHLFSVYPSTLNTLPHKGGTVFILHPKFRAIFSAKLSQTPQMEVIRPCSGLPWHGDTYLTHLLSNRGLLLTTRRALTELGVSQVDTS